mmetsp:Transcript_12686/g.36596  ORF Transcript_12686/g.36596 Transcript_12686/m.36596 type:complete len:398 (+) Transcript_12686:209-1402(+)
MRGRACVVRSRRCAICGGNISRIKRNMHHCYAPSHSPGREKTKRKVRGHRGDPAEARGSLSLFSSTLLSGFSARRCAGDTVGSETEAVPPLTCHPPDRLSNASNHGLRRLTALRLRHRVSDRRSRAAYSDDGEDQRPQADSGNGGGSAVRRRSAPRCGRGSKRGGVEQVDLSVRVRVTKGEGGFALHVSGGAPRGAERLAGLILRHTHLGRAQLDCLLQELLDGRKVDRLVRVDEVGRDELDLPLCQVNPLLALLRSHHRSHLLAVESEAQRLVSLVLDVRPVHSGVVLSERALGAAEVLLRLAVGQREGRLDALNRVVPADVLQIVHHAVLCNVKRCLDRRERCVELALLFVLPRHAHGQRRQRILLPGHRGGSQEGHSEERCGTHANGNSRARSV